MPGHAVFFGGSGHDVEKAKFTYAEWCSRFEAIGWSARRYSGVGKDRGRTYRTSEHTGAGWAAIIKDAMDDISREIFPPKKFCIVGQSRGGVQANILAHCIYTWATNHPVTPFVPQIFIFAVDPVEGWNAANSGSFDFRADRGFKGIKTSRFGNIGINVKLSNIRRQSSRYSRDQLREDYALADNAANTVHASVAYYLSVIMQFRGTNRKHGMKHGFTPQMAGSNFNTGHVPAESYELPGDHGYGVYTGNEKEGEPIDKSRRARGRVVYDMLRHHLSQSQICHLTAEVDDVDLLDDYGRIAVEDLEGRQVTGGRSNYSFLQSQLTQNNTASTSSRWHSGRGHLVSSPNLGDRPYVNARHHALWAANERRVQRFLQIVSRSAPGGSSYPNLEEWMEYRR